MYAFVIITIVGFVLTLIGSFVCLLLLNYAGTGFGFGNIPKDLLKIAVVSVIIGLIEGAWTFSTRQSLAFNVLTALVHGIILTLFFFEDLSFKEGVLVGVGCQMIYLAATLTIFVAFHTTAYNQGMNADWCTLAALVTPAGYS